MSRADTVGVYLKRRQAHAEYVARSSVPGHAVHAEKDWHHAFAARNGSPDYKAHCSCGWSSSGWHYGETEALASAYRHVRAAIRAAG